MGRWWIGRDPGEKGPIDLLRVEEEALLNWSAGARSPRMQHDVSGDYGRGAIRSLEARVGRKAGVPAPRSDLLPGYNLRSVPPLRARDTE